jgi:hypothetical protein
MKVSRVAVLLFAVAVTGNSVEDSGLVALANPFSIAFVNLPAVHSPREARVFGRFSTGVPAPLQSATVPR